MGFDIDGVLCSFLPECLAAAQKVGLVPEYIKVEDIHDDMRRQFNWPSEGYDNVFTEEFILSLPPKTNVINDVKEWIKNGHDIFYITSRSEEKEAEPTIKWLEKYGLLKGSKGIIHEKSDLKYIHALENKIQVFVDDYPKVIRTMIGVIDYPFLLEGPINRGHLDSYIHTWSEIKREINDLIYN